MLHFSCRLTKPWKNPVQQRLFVFDSLILRSSKLRSVWCPWGGFLCCSNQHGPPLKAIQNPIHVPAALPIQKHATVLVPQCQICFSPLVYTWKLKVAHSCLTLCDPMDYTVPGILQARILECSGKYYISLLQGIVPTQGYEPRSPTLQTDSLPVEPQGSPRILEWVAYPFSSRFSWPRNWTGASCIAGRFFTSWATREAPVHT